MSNLFLNINREITEDEYQVLFDICREEVEKNKQTQNGQYFLSINEDLSFYTTNQWKTEFKIVAKGAYFEDRMLVYYYKYNFEEKGLICLDDHSEGEINRACAERLRLKLMEMGATMLYD